MNGAPTAYDDLVSLFDSSSSIFEITYKTLPNPLKELIINLPDMLTPEVLRTMTPISPALSEPGKAVLNLRTLATQGTITGMFRAGVNALKLRFPILLSEGVAVGLSVSVVLFALWYCHKRGKEMREEREEREETERMEVFGVEKIKTEEEIAKEKEDKEKETTKEEEDKEKETKKEKEKEKGGKKWGFL